MNVLVVPVTKPGDMNFILGHSHFIKTVEDLYEAIVQTVPGMKFGIGFCEASGPTLVRYIGNDEELIHLARTNAMALGAGHSFIIFMKEGFPLNILNTIKNVPATAPAVGTGFDSTVANVLDFFAGFSISDAANTVKIEIFSVEALN